MTLEQFKRFIDALNAFYAAEDRLSDALSPFNSSYTVMDFCPEITNAITEYIKEYFNDEGEWFDYWFYELDQGKTWTSESCFGVNGNMIKLESVEDIYNLLKENQNDTSI